MIKNKCFSNNARGELSRRDLFKKLGAATLSSPFLSGTARADTPRKGGHLILGIDNASANDRLDPAYYFEAYMYSIAFQIFDTLVDLNIDGSPKPSLAVSWEQKESGREWIFKLRGGVTFHNGKSLTPEDVIYSINHHRGKLSESVGKGYLLAVEAVTKTGPNEITFSLSGPNVDFPVLLSDVHFVIAPENLSFDKGVGTGPYILEHFEPGVRTIVTRNENYWDQTRGHVDSVETRAYNDSSSRIAALLSHSVHIINNINPHLVYMLKNYSDINTYEQEDASLILFVGRADGLPFRNTDVRLAAKYAIDRKKILNTIFNGAGSVSNDNPIFPSNRYFTNDVPKHIYDPDKASFHWKKSGYDGKLVLSAADGASFPGAVDASLMYQQSALSAGIPFEVRRVPADGYWTNVWMKDPFVVSSWSARPTADAMLSLIYLSNAPWNESGWRSEIFDNLIRSARGEIDEIKRKKIYHDAQVLLVEENSSIIPNYASKINGALSNVKGFTTPPGVIAPRTAADVWLDIS